MLNVPLVTTAWRFLRFTGGHQIWRVTANVLNNQSRTVDKGGPPDWGMGVGLTTAHCYKEFVTPRALKLFIVACVPKEWTSKLLAILTVVVMTLSVSHALFRLQAAVSCYQAHSKAAGASRRKWVWCTLSSDVWDANLMLTRKKKVINKLRFAFFCGYWGVKKLVSKNMFTHVDWLNFMRFDLTHSPPPFVQLRSLRFSYECTLFNYHELGSLTYFDSELFLKELIH
jgi:hypothetical protein